MKFQPSMVAFVMRCQTELSIAGCACVERLILTILFNSTIFLNRGASADFMNLRTIIDYFGCDTSRDTRRREMPFLQIISPRQHHW